MILPLSQGLIQKHVGIIYIQCNKLISHGIMYTTCVNNKPDPWLKNRPPVARAII